MFLVFLRMFLEFDDSACIGPCIMVERVFVNKRGAVGRCVLRFVGRGKLKGLRKVKLRKRVLLVVELKHWEWRFRFE